MYGCMCTAYKNQVCLVATYAYMYIQNLVNMVKYLPTLYLILSGQSNSVELL